MEDVATLLAEKGWDVHVALAKGRFHHPDRYIARHPHSQWVELDGSSGLREQRMLSLLDTFESIRPDVIVPVNLFDAVVAAAHWKRSGANTRLCVTVHSQQSVEVEKLRPFSECIDLATTVSRRVAQALAQVVDERRVRHIPTGVPEPLAVPVARRALKTLGYVGRLDQNEKRVLDLIPLARGLSGDDVRIEVVGTGPEENALREELSDFVTESRIRFHGALLRDALYERIYPGLDGLLLFSPAETGPIVAWEAMIHGVVPIVSDFVGRAEEGVLHHGTNSIVFPVGDVDAAAAAIRTTPVAALERLSLSAADLPQEYRAAHFREAWQRELSLLIDSKPRSSATAIPPAVSPGFLSRLHLGLRPTFYIRRLLGRSFVHQEPGSEWPH